jgi:hypothetical protein
LDKKKVLAWTFVVAALTGSGVFVYSQFSGNPSSRVNYPYVCKDCKAVFGLQELRADDLKNCRMPKDAPSDSIVYCLRCAEGWAYPVTTCEQCGTQHILYLTRDYRCPKCFPEAAEQAREAGVEVLFKQP